MRLDDEYVSRANVKINKVLEQDQRDRVAETLA